MQPLTDIAIVGRACRLPGARTVADLWALLESGGCSVTSIPADRWSLERFGHPRMAERGRSYTWSAGCLDDIWGFDPAAFGMSPREAEMIDPQQRLLLELTWEALEDAGIRPSRLAGTDAGVFVGVSSVDHSNLRMLDMAGADAYMMTGNTLSIVANRISHVFDLRGPSLIVDTACSSSLVALDQAVSHLRSGRIETAIVGGVSILATPHAFIGFSQAAMLSRRGFCQAFSADADGYVRAEGGVVLLLQTRAAAERDGTPIRAFVAATDVNSDGRTNGISLPSKGAQSALLEKLYLDASVDLDDLAFIEAHGTGTPVGDPIEAAAVGETLATRRARPLLIGSIKTNIGHTEAASGLAGVLKAMLALEHGALPASLHSGRLNPAIDFDGLNLEVVRQTTSLSMREGRHRLAGVNSFGFGGTNAHAIIAEGPAACPCALRALPPMFVVSAHSLGALESLVAEYAARLEAIDDDGAAAIMAAAVHKRDLLPHRVALPVTTRADVAGQLRRFGAAETVPRGAIGVAIERAAPVAFVFSGNGSQFAGMGLAAYKYNASFRARLDDISVRFERLAGWSIVEALHDDDLAARIASTSIAQPLLFAIQSATNHALRVLGLEPSAVIGHSVGEVAAAEAAGILDEAGALRTVAARSRHQELTFGTGGMAIVFGARDAVMRILKELPGLSLAACNSPRAYTISGPSADISRLAAIARRCNARVRKLDLPYPFHGAAMAPVEAPLRRDLAGLVHAKGNVSFVSTVTGTELDGTDLDASYWWYNVREPVLFSDAIATAVATGARIFVEIGPAPVLLAHINDTIDERLTSIATLSSLDKADSGADPIAAAVAMAIARGARIDEAKAFGAPSAPGSRVPLPFYPWQRTTYRLGATTESVSDLAPPRWHPLIGTRSNGERLEWNSTIDTLLHPTFADHRVDDRIILPGAAFAEMALAVARDWLDCEGAALVDLEITSPLPLSEAGRDVLCRLTPLIGRVEILSRPRLSRSPWQSHASAKILRDPGVGAMADITENAASATSHRMAGADIYAAAARVGLHYGPGFRKLRSATLMQPDRILFDFTDEPADTAYGLDPARLDASFHALILAFSKPGDGDGGRPFVPVRFGDIVLRQPGRRFNKGRIDILRRDDRAITANILLTDQAGEIVAVLRDARFQAIRATPAKDAIASVIYPTMRLASEPAASRGERPLSLSAFRRGIAKAREGEDAGGFMLLEGWATSLALRLARDLATAGLIDIDALIASGRVPHRLKPWLDALLNSLERSDLCHRDVGGFRVDPAADLPEPEDIIRAIAREHQELSAELLVAAGTASALHLIGDGKGDGLRQSISAKVLDAFELGSSAASAAATDLVTLVRHSAGSWPKDRAMRILQIGFGPASAGLARLCEQTQARLTIFDPDRRRLELARLSLDGRRDVDFAAATTELATTGFDLVLAAFALYRQRRAPGFWIELRRAMAPGAIFAALEPAPSFFRDLTLGLAACLGDNDARYHGLSLIEAEWLGAMQTAGLGGGEIVPFQTAATSALLSTAQAEASRRPRVGSGTAIIIGDDDLEARSAFATLLASSGLHVSILLDDELGADRLSEVSTMIVVFAQDGDAYQDGAAQVDPVRSLSRHCMNLKRIADSVGRRPSKLWLVTSDPHATGFDRRADIAAGLWAFSRTLANEVPSLDIRRIGVADDVDSDLLARRLRDVVLSGTDETDLLLQRGATRVLRFEPSTTRAVEKGEPAEAAQLQRSDNAGADRLSWRPTARRQPGPKEIEIKVEAIGLNFRDVMFGLGLLPDEILEDGFAGPGLGLECAGRIERVGPAVKGFRAGDRVMAFAKGAFATHVTTPAAVVAPIPQDLTFETAATIPVAFLTAYHALIGCARLKPGEWVLIHGGAGGVGLAALQIARWRRARVIATASSPERRALLTALGAEHAFDSRSGSFAGDVHRVTRDGVGVVLNSLSDEAMERSIAVLRPFGRFVELGKRDFVANAHIGLRPFRRNLSYFGVDLDQLLGEKPAQSKALLRMVMRLFARGDLVPLPFRSFDAHQTAEAFSLMQQSAHVGKLVIRPPRHGDVRVPPHPTRFTVAADKIHVITGGFGGFGLATAHWLAEGGARNIMLIGRRGPVGDQARNAVAALESRGVTIWREALDVADKSALATLFARFGRDLPPLAGVIHAAMVLDDAIVAQLTAQSLDRVLRPKIVGADHLDQLTHDLELDYFVLYSSATSLIGNPGQAAYVAANGYLEGLARRRRRAGLPALAVAWGAIDDVGILARANERPLGLDAMGARPALALLGDRIGATAIRSRDDAVVAIAPITWATARERLAILKSPTYRGLVGPDDGLDRTTGRIDLAGLTHTMSRGDVHALAAELIVDEVCRVLRLPRESVSRTAPLAETGLDSLMAVELALGLEARISLPGPLAIGTSALSVNELCDHILGFASGTLDVTVLADAQLIRRHLGETLEEDVSPISGECARQVAASSRSRRASNRAHSEWNHARSDGPR